MCDRTQAVVPWALRSHNTKPLSVLGTRKIKQLPRCGQPGIPENNLDALTTAFTAVESKLLPVLSPTPLQELVIVHYKAIQWTPPNFCTDSNNNNSNNNSNAQVNTNSGDNTAIHRFLSMLSNLFTTRFGKMVKITNKNYRVTFSIL
ncbi:unnamed protein product [Trichobilharzia regenti]|nr:unnamed protein product [Trichobilharzia regenti]